MTKSSVTQNALKLKPEAQFQQSEPEQKPPQKSAQKSCWENFPAPDRETLRSALRSSASRSPQLGREKRGLTRFHQRKQLTDCLEILAQTGIQGDEAIFILSNLGGEA